MNVRFHIRLAVLLVLSSQASVASAAEAISFGDHRCGKVTGSVPAPCHGPNFEPFSKLTCEKNRNHLHPRVQQTFLDAYATLVTAVPGRTWQYGDMSKPGGGFLWPHRTHQSGRSIDFFMPLLNKAGQPTPIPNKPISELEFNRKGVLGAVRIDFDAVARHLLALEQAGKTHGVSFERIIVAPEFYSLLVKAQPEIERLSDVFARKNGGVRHDEHYHVDFRLPDTEQKAMSCRGNTTSTVASGKTPQGADGKTSTVAGDKTSVADSKSSTGAGDKTSVADGKSSTVASGKTSQVADGKPSTVIGGKTSVADGKLSTVTSSKTSVADGKSSIVASGKTSQVADGKPSTVTSGKTSQVADIKSSIVASGKTSQVADGKPSTATSGKTSEIGKTSATDTNRPPATSADGGQPRR